MKMVKLFLITILCLSFSLCLEKKQEEVDREAQAFSNGKAVDAVAYALGSNGGYTIKNEKAYRTPQIVSKLVVKQSRFEGEPEVKTSANETPSVTEYYNGSEQLNKFTVTCNMYSKDDCLHKSGCGWCGSTSKCISGNLLGPTEGCLASTYVFTTGAVSEERVVKENIGGIATTVVTK